MKLPLLVALAVGGWLLVRSSPASSGVFVVPISETIKRVLVDGRGYIVLRLGGGKYSILSERNPGIRLTLDQESEPVRVGDAASIAQLETDSHRFPRDLFRSALVH